MNQFYFSKKNVEEVVFYKPKISKRNLKRYKKGGMVKLVISYPYNESLGWYEFVEVKPPYYRLRKLETGLNELYK